MLVHEVGKIGRKTESPLEYVEFKMPFRHLSGNVSRQLDTKFAVLGRIHTADTDLGVISSRHRN